MSPLLSYVLGTAFGFLIACLLSSLVCGAVMFLSARHINDTLRHPALEHTPYRYQTLTAKLTIFLDYFLRLALPNVKSGMIGHANQLLPHVDRKNTPISVRWPLYGFWGGCFIGIVAMLTVWIAAALGGVA